MIKYHSQNKD